jgi:hypothetical protein
VPALRLGPDAAGDGSRGRYKMHAPHSFFVGPALRPEQLFAAPLAAQVRRTWHLTLQRQAPLRASDGESLLCVKHVAQRGRAVGQWIYFM